MNVLFVCLHGSAKSLIAAEYFNRLAAERGLSARATSAGTEPDDAIPPRVTQGLGADGIDVTGRRPRRPTQAEVDGSAVVVTFGCDLGEPVSPDYGARGNDFNGTVKWVRIDIDAAAKDVDHTIGADERFQLMLAKQ